MTRTLTPFVAVDNKLNDMTESKAWKFWKAWKYPILSAALALGVFTYNGVTSNAAVRNSTWTNAAFETWVNDASSSNTLVDENGATIFTGTNRELYEFYKSHLQSSGIIFYDNNQNGNVDSDDVYFDSSDFDTLLKMALTPYEPANP